MKKNKKTKTLYTDGDCEGNRQKDISKRLMKICVTDEDGNPLFVEEKKGGSNNVAEFYGILRALKEADNNNWERIKIKTDSKNNLAWFKKNPDKKFNQDMNCPNRVRKIKDKIEELKEEIEVELEWVPREENKAGIYLEYMYEEADVGSPNWVENFIGNSFSK